MAGWFFLTVEAPLREGVRHEAPGVFSGRGFLRSHQAAAGRAGLAGAEESGQHGDR
jgi:hypothetical protein